MRHSLSGVRGRHLGNSIDGLCPGATKSADSSTQWVAWLGIKLGKIRLSGSSSGTAYGFPVKCPSLERHGPFCLPARRPTGVRKIPESQPTQGRRPSGEPPHRRVQDAEKLSMHFYSGPRKNRGFSGGGKPGEWAALWHARFGFPPPEWFFGSFLSHKSKTFMGQKGTRPSGRTPAYPLTLLMLSRRMSISRSFFFPSSASTRAHSSSVSNT